MSDEDRPEDVPSVADVSDNEDADSVVSDSEVSDSDDGGAADGDSFGRLLRFITESRAMDFSGYKRSSLSRRLHKRMDDAGVRTYDDYRDLLETKPEEFRLLFDTVLINVTGFFRDPRAWEFLRSEVVPEIVESARGDEIRVWSAGCSTGEEPYSLAIMFAEAIGADAFRDQVKIYATDVDEDALRIARQGLYTTKALEPLSEELINKYFEPTGSAYTFRADLRRRVIYGLHDITHDAPISRLQFLSCRNTLMYFNSEAQNQILDRFHFALRDKGTLFLGKAEMLLSDGSRFEALSMPHRIFQRRPGSHGYRPVATPVTLEGPKIPHAALRGRQLRDIALDASPVANLLVDINGTVTLINNEARAQFGLTGRDEGRPLRDLEISYRPAELRSLIDQAQAERRVVRLTGLERHLSPQDTQFLDVQVQPLISDDGMVLGVSVTFTDTTTLVGLRDDAKHAREDLETAYEELQSTNEELETTNEELQSSIEELETTNEELQSTNEELETTNEELQSSNEELETMNDELRAWTDELDATASYLEAILARLPIGLVVLDSNLEVRTWNARVADLFGLRADEVVGRPFLSLDFGLPTRALVNPVRACASSGSSEQVSIDGVSRLGRHIMCQVNVRPLGDRDRGVVLSITNTEVT